MQNRERSYDDSIIRGLLYTVSLFPIGSYVYLSNRKIAQVIDTNPDNPKTPIIQYLTEKEADGSPKVSPTGSNGINIVRILSKDEEKDILELVKDKYKDIEEAQAEAAASPNTDKPTVTLTSENKPNMASTEEVDITQFS